MKNTHKQNTTLNTLILLLLALFFLAGTMVWKQGHRYQDHNSMQQESTYQQSGTMMWKN